SLEVSTGEVGRASDVMVLRPGTRRKSMPALEIRVNPEVVGDVNSAGTATFGDLPIAERSYSARRPIKGSMDVIARWGAVKEAMSVGRCNDMPPPLVIPDASQSDAPCVTSVLVSKSLQGRNYLVVKVFTFLGGGKPMAAVLDKIVAGDPRVLDYRPGVSEKTAALDKARGFVQAEAPRGNFDGQKLLCVDSQFVGPESPPYNMQRELVNSLVKCIADRGHFAVKGDCEPLLKSGVRKECQPMASWIWQTLAGNVMFAIKWGREAGFGPFVCILAVAPARRRADVADERRPGRAKAAIRVSAEMDIFRGKVGEPWALCIFDDCDCADQRRRVLEAFFDPAQARATTCARWRAA
ncbi:unnamed protein product, partial [Prorocentrum cordatum]